MSKKLLQYLMMSLAFTALAHGDHAAAIEDDEWDEITGKNKNPYYRNYRNLVEQGDEVSETAKVEAYYSYVNSVEPIGWGSADAMDRILALHDAQEYDRAREKEKYGDDSDSD